MAENDWQDVSEEVIEKEGKIVAKRITRNAKGTTSPYSSFKEWVELILKIAGLATIILTIFKYFDSVSERQQEAIHLRISDSTSNDHWKKEQLDQQKIIADAELKQKQDDAAHHEELEKRLANNLELISAQKQVDIDKEKREFYLTTLTTASINLEILLDKPFSSKEYKSSRDLVFIELVPRIAAIGDTALIKTVLSFKDILSLKEYIDGANQGVDSLRESERSIRIKLGDNYNDILKNRENRISNSLEWFKDQINNMEGVKDQIHDYLSQIQIAEDTRPMLLPSNFPKNVSQSEYVMNDIGDFIADIDRLIVSAKEVSGSDSVFKILLNKWALRPGPQMHLRFDMLPGSDQLLAQLRRKKAEFDGLIQRKMNFYQDARKR